MYIDIGFKKSTTKGYPSILREDYSPNFVNKLLGRLNPFWLSLNQSAALNEIFEENPVLYCVIEKKASFAANMEINVRDIRTGKIYKKNKPLKGQAVPDMAQKMLDLIYNPNPLQSKYEFIKSVVINHELHGNSYLYGNFKSFSKFNIDTIVSLKNLYPHMMKPIVNNGSYLSATSEGDIIKRWDYTGGFSSRTQELNINEVLHRKNTNVKINTIEDFILGKPKAIPLYRPLSNIQVNYESLNVIGRERGMRTIISSEKENAQLGSLPLTSGEKKELQEEMRDYGYLEGQNQVKFTRQPVKVTQIDQDIRKLALREGIATDMMMVSHTFGVAEVLLKLYPEGVTYENQMAGERQTYLNTIIPESSDWIEDINVWLQTRVFGFEYLVSFDHIKVLQENEKDRAIINRNNSVTMRDLFMGGGCTYDEWRISLGLDPDTGIYGDKHIYELPEEMIMAITGRNLINAQNDLKNQANNNPNA